MRAAQFLLLSAAAAAADGFAFPPSSLSPQGGLALAPSFGRILSGRPSHDGGVRLMGSKEDEIAALEEKLRLLKEDAVKEEEEVPAAAAASGEAETAGEVVTAAEEGEKSYAVGKPTKKRGGVTDAASKMMGERRGPNDVDPFYSEMLSESWKESDSSSGSGGGGIMGAVVPALGAIAALVVLGLFSQVPVGQEDLSKYSTVGSAPSTRIDLGDKNPVKSVKDTVYTGE